MALMGARLFPKHHVRREDERWGQAVTMSVAAHVLLALLFVLSGDKPQGGQEGAGPVLTQINFLEKPVELPVAAAPEPAAGLPDTQAQAPSAVPQSVVAFAAPAPSGAPVRVEAVNAPIVPNAPIMPIGQVGAIGMKKAALAPLPSHADATTAKKGPIAMPMMGGGGQGKGAPIALNTQGVDDVRRGGGGGPVISMTTARGGTGVPGGMIGGKPVDASAAGLTPAKKAPIETLKASAIDKDNWGKKNSPFSMEGPLKYRKIKLMGMPPYPRWAEEQGVEASVSFRIWVDPKGKVKENMYLEKTSGYTELDNLAKEALLKFTFVPLPDGQPLEDEWGVATFRFELKK